MAVASDRSKKGHTQPFHDSLGLSSARWVHSGRVSKPEIATVCHSYTYVLHSPVLVACILVFAPTNSMVSTIFSDPRWPGSLSVDAPPTVPNPPLCSFAGGRYRAVTVCLKQNRTCSTSTANRLLTALRAAVSGSRHPVRNQCTPAMKSRQGPVPATREPTRAGLIVWSDLLRKVFAVCVLRGDLHGRQQSRRSG